MHPVQFAAVATNATRLLGARGQGSASLGSRHETGNPGVRARAKLPAANHRSAGPRSAHPPGPRRARRSVERPFEPARKTVRSRTPARQKHKYQGAGGAFRPRVLPCPAASRAFDRDKDNGGTHARVGLARGRGKACRCRGPRPGHARSGLVGSGSIGGSSVRSYYSARRMVTPFSSVHVLHCLDKLCCSWLGCASERRKQAAVVRLLFVPGSTSRAGMQHLLCTRRHLPFMNSFSLPDFQSPKQESRLQ